MMSNLTITTWKDGQGHINYKIFEFGTGTIYMVTRNKQLAEETLQKLNLEYQRENDNASQV